MTEDLVISGESRIFFSYGLWGGGGAQTFKRSECGLQTPCD